MSDSHFDKISRHFVLSAHTFQPATATHIQLIPIQVLSKLGISLSLLFIDTLVEECLS